MKVAELPADATDYAFIRAFDTFLKRLARSTRSTNGFVAIHRNLAERERIAKRILRRNPRFKSRIELTSGGNAYDASWYSNEFWLIPKGAKPPYRRLTYDVACPTIEVAGTPTIASNETTLTFVANIRGGVHDSPIRYRWKVVGGRIADGQYSPAITVRARPRTASVTASVEILGLDEEYVYCMHSASFTTKIIPM